MKTNRPPGSPGILLVTVKVTCLAVLMLSSSNVVYAENFGGPDAVPNQLERDQGAWTTFQKEMAEKGVKFSIDYSTVGLSASDALEGADDEAASGMLRFYGSWDLVGKGSPNLGSLIWKVENRHDYTDTAPKFLLFGTGTQGLVTPPFSDEGGRLTNLYWRQRFNGGRSTVVGGLLDVTDYLDVYALASPWTGFMNFAFSTGTNTIALPGDATLGVAGATMLGDNFFLIGGLADMNSEPTDPLETFDSFFNDNKYFKSIELGWTDSQEQIYTDNIHVTLWHADTSKVQGTDNGWGVNFSGSRLYGKWLPFLRGGYSKDTGTLFEKSVSAGVGYLGLGGANNTLGIATNWGDVDGGDDQWMSEIYYLWTVIPQLEITFNYQWVAEPLFNDAEDDITVAGIRLRLNL
ncbi:MAG: carbohydrate porin [Nitrospirota bacterium]|nr:carbohydrate porin [Nitrospirota bacterium]